MASRWRKADDAKVREYCEKLLRVRPGAKAALEGLTAAAIARGDYQNRGHSMRAQLVKAAPKSYEAWFNLGVAYQKTNRLEQAGQAYSEAIKLQPESELAYANLGTTLQERGDLPAARKAYERALQIAPGHTGALWNLSHRLREAGLYRGRRKVHGKSGGE